MPLGVWGPCGPLFNSTSGGVNQVTGTEFGVGTLAALQSQPEIRDQYLSV